MVRASQLGVVAERSEDNVRRWIDKFRTVLKDLEFHQKEGDFITTSDDNPCGLKGSINKKSGKVSGSFKVYVQKSEKKVKSYSAKISGYLGSDITVTVKKAGTFGATLE